MRGKTAKPVEFGAKISISHIPGGFVSLHRLSWDAYNEGGDLVEQIESYHRHFGFYPVSVHADTIYRNRTNRAYCQEKGIPVEGKFGNAKRKGSLERIMAKLVHTSVNVINIGLIVLNLDTWLRRHLLLDLFSARQGGLLALNQSRKVQTATGRCFCWFLSAKVRI